MDDSPRKPTIVTSTHSDVLWPQSVLCDPALLFANPQPSTLNSQPLATKLDLVLRAAERRAAGDFRKFSPLCGAKPTTFAEKMWDPRSAHRTHAQARQRLTT